MITCEQCPAEFVYIAERDYPTLCLDHAADASRNLDGWTPANSQN